MRKSIAIKIKQTSEPLPIPEVTATETRLGKSIGFDHIESSGIKAKTWTGYINFIVRFYKHFNLPDKDQFYWEFLSQESTIKEMIGIVLNTYHVKDGNSLAAKLSPFRSVVFRLPMKNTLDALTIWGETIINVRKNFISIVYEYGDQIKQVKKRQIDERAITKGPGNWINAYEQLHNVTINKSIDNRVRVLATIYKYGYVFRMSTIFRTYIHLGDDDNRDDYNYLDLDNGTWSITEDGVQKVEFPIPYKMAQELQSLTMGGSFVRGWVLPQRRGIPYAPEASISSFSSWTKQGLANYRTYRRIYNMWLKEGILEEEYQLFQGILDNHINFDEIRFMPPLPDIILPEPEPTTELDTTLSDNAITKASREQDDGSGKEIVPESGVELDADTDADTDTSDSDMDGSAICN
jgi:hypothetical protein